MTKEQEAIERLNRFKTIKVLYGNTFAMHTEQLKTLQEDLETALNMLKEKDRQIDLMAEFISKQDVEEEICIKNKTNPDWCNEDYTNCKDCIKQYYERKSKE